ncbi:DUF4132 domain-containing protein [Streptomyces sp. NBC_01264]|uniref:DUF4132 domain-containing protein n=1 Tax=Streptomyces sp. NBC_01264 TaxID=2903804 RepID=UPI002B1D9D06|nr:DUF4132 domain-containing protein [Streptomyces sp. NBC_01264]
MPPWDSWTVPPSTSASGGPTRPWPTGAGTRCSPTPPPPRPPARPSAKWEKTARALLTDAGAGPDALREAVAGWFALVDRPRTLPLTDTWYENQLDPFNANALRGLAWLLALLPPHPGTPRALGRLVETCLRKIPGLGPRNPKVANAGVVALSRTEGEAALAELARLAARVTFKGTLKVIDTALTARAAALGLSREEIEELAVPAYGLTEVGRAEFRLGEATALLEVRGAKASLSWRNAAGKAVKAVPAAVRQEHAEELGELKAAVKDIDKMLSAQAERLDRQFLARRTWTYRAWRERYLDHPLVGTLARRLVWTVDGTPVAFADGEARTLTGDPVTEGTVVELWHPVGRGAAEVAAVREQLEELGVTQPFKQAHREVYPLTEAERNTGTYSNRFAAHILRQHQFHALAAARGWRNQLRLCVDDSAPPATRELPQWGLRAEYWRGQRPHLVRRRTRGPVPGVLDLVRLRRARPERRDPAGAAGAAGAEAGDRGPLPRRGPVPARHRRAAHVQDPPGLGQHPDGAERPVPVHRAEGRRLPGRGLPALRGRPDPRGDPQQGDAAGR